MHNLEIFMLASYPRQVKIDFKFDHTTEQKPDILQLMIQIWKQKLTWVQS